MRGGAGGSYFEYQCEPGHVLVGLRAYAGLWLDNVQAVCAHSVATGLADAEPVGPVFGGANARTTTGYELS